MTSPTSSARFGALNPEAVQILKEGLAEVRVSEEFSDCKLVCGTHEFKLHKIILMTQSGYFKSAFKKGAFKEGESGTIELKAMQSGSEASEEPDDSCDDPEIVKLMVEFFYHFDYLPNTEPPSPELSDSENELAWTRSAFGAAAKRAVLRSKVRADPPVEEPATESSSPATASASATSQQRVYLIEHAKVFAMALKYQVEGLRLLAAAKFKKSARAYWNHDDFAQAISVVHSSTPSHVTRLRDIVGDVIYEHLDALRHKPQIDALVRGIPLLAYGLLTRAATIAGCANGHSGQMTATACRYCHARVDICEHCQAWKSCPNCREDIA